MVNDGHCRRMTDDSSGVSADVFLNRGHASDVVVGINTTVTLRHDRKKPIRMMDGWVDGAYNYTPILWMMRWPDVCRSDDVYSK